ncbi:MAG: Ig-like domain-containing protein [Deltaproteobacteria bacterium]|nr:Ig-like domain-containing protein [Deltaproteobacteria bacterium]
MKYFSLSKKTILQFLILSTFAFTACSGGGGGGSNPTPTPAAAPNSAINNGNVAPPPGADTTASAQALTVTITSPVTGATSAATLLMTATTNRTADCAFRMDDATTATPMSATHNTTHSHNFTGPSAIAAGPHTLQVACVDAANSSFTANTQVTFNGPVTTGFEVSSITPNAGISLLQTASGALTIHISRTGGMTDAVVVTLSDLPAGVTADALSIADSEGTLTLHTNNTSIGDYSISMHLNSGTLHQDATITLSVSTVSVNVASTPASPINTNAARPIRFAVTVAGDPESVRMVIKKHLMGPARTIDIDPSKLVGCLNIAINNLQCDWSIPDDLTGTYLISAIATKEGTDFTSHPVAVNIDRSPLTFTSTIANKDQNVNVNTPIRLTFNRPVTIGSIQLSRGEASSLLPNPPKKHDVSATLYNRGAHAVGPYVLSSDRKTVTVTPSEAPSTDPANNPNRLVLEGIQDDFGNTLDPTTITFSYPKVIKYAVSAAKANSPEVTTTNDGIPLVAFRQYDAATSAYYLIIKKFNSATQNWEAMGQPLIDTTTTSSSVYAPSLSVAPNGKIYVAFAGNNTTHVAYWGENSWDYYIASPLPVSTSDVSKKLSLKVNPSTNEPIVAGVVEGGLNIVEFSEADSSWHSPISTLIRHDPSSTKLGQPSLALVSADSGPTVFVSWNECTPGSTTSGSVTTPYAGCNSYFSPASSPSPTRVATTSGNNAHYPKLVMNSPTSAYLAVSQGEDASVANDLPRRIQVFKFDGTNWNCLTPCSLTANSDGSKVNADEPTLILGGSSPIVAWHESVDVSDAGHKQIYARKWNETTRQWENLFGGSLSFDSLTYNPSNQSFAHSPSLAKFRSHIYICWAESSGAAYSADLPETVYCGTENKSDLEYTLSDKLYTVSGMAADHATR